jgi:hypothetical protein
MAGRDESPWGFPTQVRTPLRERLRWLVAYLLNRSRRVCWTELVVWAMATRDEQRSKRKRHPLRAAVGTGACREDAAQTGVCFCGKFREGAS